MNSRDFSRRLLAWFDRHGRHDLPWQLERDTYRVWVSEIMLQQTQVATVIPYFERFMARFPTLQTLADAPIDDVLHHWSGLGYYARARNLHRAAAIACERHQGQLPEDIDALIALPGIGRSTAGAILAQACGQRYAILDGNVKRVLARFAAVDGWPGKAAVSKALWNLAETYTPSARVADYTQAIMDLGATVCTRSRPDCGQCPLAGGCRAHAQGRASEFPGRRPRKQIPVRQTRMLLIRRGDAVLLIQRPPSGVWGGLWSLPEVPATEEDAIAWCSDQLGIVVLEEASWPELRHTFSHFHLDITPVVVRVQAAHAVLDAPDTVWYNPARPQSLGLAAPVSKLLARLDPTAGEEHVQNSKVRRTG